MASKTLKPKGKTKKMWAILHDNLLRGELQLRLEANQADAIRWAELPPVGKTCIFPVIVPVPTSKGKG